MTGLDSRAIAKSAYFSVVLPLGTASVVMACAAGDGPAANGTANAGDMGSTSGGASAANTAMGGAATTTTNSATGGSATGNSSTGGDAPDVTTGTGGASGGAPTASGGMPGDVTTTGGMGGSPVGGAGPQGMAGGTPAMAMGTVTESGTDAVAEIGDLRLVADSSFGARVTEFSLGGVNMLYQDPSPTADVDSTGSTFWPSPQTVWNWPPPANIDQNEYMLSVADNVATMQSTAELGITVTKTVSINAAGDAIDVSYQMDGSADFAPWKITRVAGGITFYEGQGTPVLDCLAGVENMAGYTWFEMPSSGGATPGDPCENPKINQDGTGWLANVNPTTRLLIVQSFPDISPADFAEGEAEIEVYASPDKGFVEIEAQGAFGAVAGSQPWTVTWRLLAVPAETEIAVGSQSLVDLVLSALGQ